MKQKQASILKPRVWKVLFQAAIPLAMSSYFLYKGKPVISGILFGLGAMMLITGFLVPALFNRIEKIGQELGRVVSVAITWILLVPMFYLVFVPGRLILKLNNIDPMCRQFPTNALTYWVPRKPVADVDNYKRQY